VTQTSVEEWGKSLNINDNYVEVWSVQFANTYRCTYWNQNKIIGIRAFT